MARLVDLIGLDKAPIEDINVAGKVNEGLKAGINLATAKEQIEEKKVKLEEDKANLAIRQATTANSLLTNLARANPAVGKMMLKQVREKLLNLGVDPEIANYTISDDANRQRQIAFSNMAGGSLTQNKDFAGEYFQSLASVVGYDKAAQMFDDELKNRQELRKQERQIQGQKDIVSMQNQAKSERGGAGLTMGEKARDVKFAKEFADFFDAGGASAVEANLESLNKSIATLEQGKTTQAEGFVPDIVGNVAFPETANVRTNVTGVLIQGLKDTFGGQLSDGERKAMVESAYVSSADPKDNASRVRALSNKIKAGAKAKELAGQYFEEHGTLKGFKGTKSFNIGDKTVSLDPEKSKSPTADAGIEAKRQAAIKAGYSPEEVDAYIQKLMNARK